MAIGTYVTSSSFLFYLITQFMSQKFFHLFTSSIHMTFNLVIWFYSCIKIAKSMFQPFFFFFTFSFLACKLMTFLILLMVLYMQFGQFMFLVNVYNVFFFSMQLMNIIFLFHFLCSTLYFNCGQYV